MEKIINWNIKKRLCWDGEHDQKQLLSIGFCSHWITNRSRRHENTDNTMPKFTTCWMKTNEKASTHIETSRNSVTEAQFWQCSLCLPPILDPRTYLYRGTRNTSGRGFAKGPAVTGVSREIWEDPSQLSPTSRQDKPPHPQLCMRWSFQCQNSWLSCRGLCLLKNNFIRLKKFYVQSSTAPEHKSIQSRIKPACPCAINFLYPKPPKSLN